MSSEPFLQGREEIEFGDNETMTFFKLSDTNVHLVTVEKVFGLDSSIKRGQFCILKTLVYPERMKSILG